MVKSSQLDVGVILKSLQLTNWQQQYSPFWWSCFHLKLTIFVWFPNITLHTRLDPPVAWCVCLCLQTNAAQMGYYCQKRVTSLSVNVNSQVLYGEKKNPRKLIP